MFKGLRTVIVNGLAALPIVWQLAVAMLLDPQTAQLIPAEHMGLYTLAVIAANGYMRHVTDTPPRWRQR